MEKKFTPAVCLAIYSVGILIYALHYSILHSALFLTSVMYFISYGFLSLKYFPKRIHILAPFVSGFVIFFLKIPIVYWDRFDLSVRVNNLLFISLLFSIFLLIKEYHLLGRIVGVFNQQSLKKRLIIIFTTLEIILVLSAVIITEKDVQFTGDEPHYLVISQSLVRDIDLNVYNQYEQHQWKEFLDAKKIGTHGYFGKKGRDHIYSIHLPGVSITLAPLMLFNLKGKAFFILVRAYLGLFASLLAVFIYLISFKLWGKKTLSLFIVCVFSLTTPIFFLSTHIYPEIQVLLLVISALYLLLFSRNKDRILNTTLAGILLGMLLFWGVKYAIYLYLFGLGFFIYFFKKKSFKQATAFLLGPVLFQGLFWTYLYTAYGNFSQLSVYMNESQKADFLNVLLNKISMKMRLEGLLDFFFDQRDGLLLYNPFYLVAFPGFILALSKWKKYKTHIMLAIPGILFFTSYALLTHRGGFCPQARPLAPAVWLFMMFGVIYYIESKNKMFKRIFYKIPLYSLFIIIFQVFHPFSIYQTTTSDNMNRAGLLFQELSNFYVDLPSLLPSFSKVEGNDKYLPNIIFLLVFILLIVFSLVKIKQKRLYGIQAMILLGILILFVLLPQVPHFNPLFISKPDVIPHKLYGASLYPQKRKFREFEIINQQTRIITLSTFIPVNSFIFRFKNNKNVRLNIEIYNFDDPVGHLFVGPLESKMIGLNVFRSKGHGQQFYYRFKVSLKNPETDIDCVTEILPVKKINIEKIIDSGFTSGLLWP